jgi:putative hemolysin
MLWLLIAALCAISFLFAGIEAGLLSVDTVGLRQHVKQRTPGAERLALLLEKPERLLVTVLLITNTAQIVALVIATHLLVQRFGYLGYFITVAGAIPISLFVLGVLPKSLFRRFPFRALAALGGILHIVSLLLWPVLEIGGRLGRLLLPNRVTDRGRLFAAREELKQIAIESEREGSLTSTERAMIHNVVDFRNIRARDVMTPLKQCVTINPKTPVDEVLQLARTSGRDHFPVVSGGQAVGLVNVLDIVADKAVADSLGRYTRRIVTAAANEPAYQIIRRLRAARLSLAAVIDSKRKLIGIATDEELIKRLVQSA